MKVKLDDWNEFQSNLDSAICILAYFKNLTTKLHVIYVFNTHIKYHANQMSFIIRFIILICIHNLKYKNLKFKYLIDERAMDLWSFGKSASLWNLLVI